VQEHTQFVGLDVHASTIAVAVAQGNGSVRDLGVIPNRPQAVQKLFRKLGRAQSLRACYEAGPCGYVLYWQLTELGVHCDVVAPTLVPVRPGDRVKTDRRDARKLARSYRSGDLTPVWVPDRSHEALRDLVRARESAKKDQLRLRHRLGKFLLRHGVQPPSGIRPWTVKHRAWLQTLRFEEPALEATLLDAVSEVDHARDRIARLERAIDEAIEAAPETIRAVVAGLQTLRGIAKMSAVTVVAELGQLTRFEHPRQLMDYAGIVSSEDSSGARTRRGPITKTGNSHLRRVVVEAGWSYRHRPRVAGALRKRQEGQSEEVKGIAWKAQHRLCGRYRTLLGKGKLKQKVVTAVGRELLGFIWAIAVQIEREMTHSAGSRRQAA
jgi:transposase